MSEPKFSAKHSAFETANWLAIWCPASAHASALAMHEVAAWSYDDEVTEHWRKVLTLLATGLVQLPNQNNP